MPLLNSLGGWTRVGLDQGWGEGGGMNYGGIEPGAKYVQKFESLLTGVFQDGSH